MGVALQFPGVGSGLDTTAVVTALVNAERAPIQALQTKQTNIASATSTISALSTKVGTLKAAADALATTSGYSSYVASSSDPAIVASASGSAIAGSYQVSVQALAYAQKTFSNAQTSGSTALNMTGSISLAVGTGTAVNFPVASGDTLNDIATKINTGGQRVSASVAYDGTAYRLMIVGLDTGAANNITLGESGTTLGLTVPANTVTAAQNARITVDGFPQTSATNQFSGFAPGLTFAATKLTTSNATVTVATDPTALTTKLKTFVAAYNDIVNSGHTAAGYGTAKALNPVLSGDQSVRSTLDQLARITYSQVPGSSGAYTTLGSVGLKANADGTLALDTTKLASAVAADPNGVQKLFVTDASTGATGVMKTYSDTATSLTTAVGGALSTRLTTFGSQTRTIQTSIDSMNARLDLYQKQLSAQFTAMDLAVSKIKAAFASFTGGSAA